MTVNKKGKYYFTKQKVGKRYVVGVMKPSKRGGFDILKRSVHNTARGADKAFSSYKKKYG